MKWIIAAILGAAGVIASIIGLAFRAGRIVRSLEEIERQLRALTQNDLPHLYEAIAEIRVDLAAVTARLDSLARDVERAG